MGKGALLYITAQVFGGFFGGLLIWALTGTVWNGPEPGQQYSAGQGNLFCFCDCAAFMGELIWTVLLVLVVLNCATVKIREGNSFFGIAIGFTVAAGAFCIGPISGGGFNPAVASAGIVLSAMAKGTTIKYLWIYILAPFLGSVLHLPVD